MEAGRLSPTETELTAALLGQLAFVEHVAHLVSRDYGAVPADLLELGFIPEVGNKSLSRPLWTRAGGGRCAQFARASTPRSGASRRIVREPRSTVGGSEDLSVSARRPFGWGPPRSDRARAASSPLPPPLPLLLNEGAAEEAVANSDVVDAIARVYGAWGAGGGAAAVDVGAVLGELLERTICGSDGYFLVVKDARSLRAISSPQASCSS